MRPDQADRAPFATATPPLHEAESFADVLDDWMHRTPWLACSLALHAVVAFVLLAIPWEVFDDSDSTTIIATLPQPLEEVFEEPPVETFEELEELEVEEPVLQDAAVDDVESDLEPSAETPAGAPDLLNEPSAEAFAPSLIGIGGGGFGRKYEGRFGSGRARAGAPTITAIERAKDWLARHQDADGHWDADGFEKHDAAGDACGGPGEALHDVGLTGLALLAFLGDGSTTTRGSHAENVARGVAFLRKEQDPDTGLIGDDLGQSFLYDHAIATFALCEAYYFSKSPLLKRTAQRAVRFILRARNPYAAWRYDAQPNGDNDTSVTGWMVFALKSAEEAGLDVEPAAFAGALSWFDEVTDPSTGRVGYTTRGSQSSRIPRINDHYPRDRGEALTAVGLLCRILLGQDPAEDDSLRQHAELLLHQLPEWDPDGLGTDMYYWYYGTYAMFQMGGRRYWKPWNEAMKSAILESQRDDGCARGSWDPVGPWGYAGGRVYSTACMVLCLEVYFRYGRVLGAR